MMAATTRDRIESYASRQGWKQIGELNVRETRFQAPNGVTIEVNLLLVHRAGTPGTHHHRKEHLMHPSEWDALRAEDEQDYRDQTGPYVDLGAPGWRDVVADLAAEDDDDFEPVCDNGCPDGARGVHKFSCPLAGQGGA